MALLHKLFARRIARHRECRHLRPWLEALERRDCPAVQAFFAGGVLTVVGDGENNVIELFQPQDRVVQVVGDGQSWVFTDVDEVFVDAGDGDDQATSSKPKEIVVVGSKIKLDMGAGNDTVRIDDGGPIEEEPDLLSTMNFSVNLGTGADELRVAAGNSATLNLSVQSADGRDRHELGHILGFRHEHTRPESHIQMDLAGSGNLVDVNFDNIEQVDLSIVSRPLPAEPISFGGQIHVHFHVIQTGSGVPVRDDGVAILYSSLPGGDAEGPSSGISPTSFSFSATAGSADVPTSASAAITTGDADDTLSIQSRNVDDLLVDLDTGDGDDEVEVESQSSDPFAFVRDGRSTGMVVDLGDGDNRLSVETSGFDEVTQDLRCGDGNDQIEVADRAGPFYDFKATRLRQTIRTGGGNDIVLDDTQGRLLVETAIETGAGDDGVNVHGTVFDHVLPATAHVAISLGAGNDIAALDFLGYSQIAATIDTGPAGDGRDLIVGTISLSPLDRLKRVRRVLDGRQDLVELFVSADYDVQISGDGTTLIVVYSRSGLVPSFPS